MSAALVPGTKLGRYEIHSPIGAGGVGEVYPAQDTSRERAVALKVLPEDVASNRNRMQRFVQEAKVASALKHPNIITIYEIGTEPTSVRTYHSLRQKSRARVLSVSDSNPSRLPENWTVNLAGSSGQTRSLRGVKRGYNLCHDLP